ncbi:MAG TPA: EAL domain-containing protein, partial [Telluria sp.]|nr:EAL domain-containing protein [Telluria sp.]
VMRSMLRHWLESLKRLQSYEAGSAPGEADLSDVPTEIQEAIEAVKRGTAAIRSEYGQRIALLMNSLIQHKSAMDQAAIVCEVDTFGRVLAVNEQFTRLTGKDRADLAGKPLSGIGGKPAGRGGWTPSRQVWNGEVIVPGLAGDLHWYRTIVPIFDAEANVEKYICIDIDITERKEFERTVLENAKRQTMIAALGQKALEAASLDELFRHACNTAAQGLGCRFAALLEADPARHKVVLRAGAGWPMQVLGSRYDFTPGADDAVREPRLRAWSAELRAEHGIRSGVDAAIFSGTRLFGTIGVYLQGDRQFSSVELDFLKSIANTLATAIERAEAKDRLTYLAQYDPLTNLPNRRRVASCLHDAISRAGDQGAACSVLVIDLDRFKNVNDMLGHGAGDQLLVQVARRLVDCVHAGDVVGRLGADEFAVVLPEVANHGQTGDVAARIVEAMARPFRLQGQQVYVTASVGIAGWPDDGGNADELLKAADTAMYSAKGNGRNNYQFFLAEMNENATHRLQTESLLRGALQRGEFELHYQPKVSLEEGKLCGFEALLRWRHPERGLVPPAEFITILEDTSMIIEVGEWIIGHVCRQQRLWQLAGVAVVPVAINLSARQFQQSDLAAVIQRIVRASGIDPRLIEFEITESMLMTDPEAAVTTLTAIKEQGMRLSVDDFGTGYSSLAYLKRFPLDALKIDRTFVRDLPDDSDDAAITRAVISLAHHLSLEVVAEGVETVEQLRALRAYDCDVVQGYFISRPLTTAQCDAVLAAPHTLGADLEDARPAA